jgi:hypothetical protein
MSSWPARCAGVMPAASRSPHEGALVVVVLVVVVLLDEVEEVLLEDAEAVGALDVEVVVVCDEVGASPGVPVHAAGAATASARTPTPSRRRAAGRRSVTGGTYLPGAPTGKPLVTGRGRAAGPEQRALPLPRCCPDEGR